MLLGAETFEIAILKTIQSTLRCDLMDWLMKFFSSINDNGFLWIVVAVILLCSKKYHKSGIMVVIGLLLGLLIGNGIVKNLVARPRPCWIDTGILLLSENPMDYSFPSGHTLSSFIAAFVLMDADKRMGIAALCVATAIAFSRLYLGVHFPTDILGGILIATLIFVFMKIVLKRIKML